ncbi:MAG: nuclear transport factor 2 family protein [Rhodospirillales bacterium]|nr:nuclear transport factor 2 family protein [Rhodospirillales bacterium]
MSDFDPARERPAVLFANEAFYRAFADRDFKAMAGLWANDLAAVCIHPGWPALTGRARILASWERILGGQAPAVACHLPEVHFVGETALVVCYEAIRDDWLVATNGFAREGGRWRMVFHQAGPTPPMGAEIASRAEEDDDADGGPALPN